MKEYNLFLKIIQKMPSDERSFFAEGLNSYYDKNTQDIKPDFFQLSHERTGNTILHEIAYSNAKANVDLAGYCLSKGADPEKMNKLGFSPEMNTRRFTHMKNLFQSWKISGIAEAHIDKTRNIKPTLSPKSWVNATTGLQLFKSDGITPIANREEAPDGIEAITLNAYRFRTTLVDATTGLQIFKADGITPITNRKEAPDGIEAITLQAYRSRSRLVDATTGLQIFKADGITPITNREEAPDGIEVITRDAYRLKSRLVDATTGLQLFKKDSITPITNREEAPDGIEAITLSAYKGRKSRKRKSHEDEESNLASFARDDQRSNKRARLETPGVRLFDAQPNSPKAQQTTSLQNIMQQITTNAEYLWDAEANCSEMYARTALLLLTGQRNNTLRNAIDAEENKIPIAGFLPEVGALDIKQEPGVAKNPVGYVRTTLNFVAPGAPRFHGVVKLEEEPTGEFKPVYKGCEHSGPEPLNSVTYDHAFRVINQFAKEAQIAANRPNEVVIFRLEFGAAAGSKSWLTRYANERGYVGHELLGFSDGVDAYVVEYQTPDNKPVFHPLKDLALHYNFLGSDSSASTDQFSPKLFFKIEGFACGSDLSMVSDTDELAEPTSTRKRKREDDGDDEGPVFKKF